MNKKCKGGSNMITLENEYLTITMNPLGAELTSVVDRATNYEFMWQADPEFWGRHAPVLFPIVGRLKDNQYQYNGEIFEMTQHGFARDAEFEVVEQTDSMALFCLKSSDKTKENYPFDFELYIQYTLNRKNVVIKYKVINPSTTEEMYYAIGGHPAFNVSQKETATGELEFDQVTVEIKPNVEITHLPLTKEGLIADSKANLQVPGEMALTHETFHNDALVYKIDSGKAIELKDKANNVQINVLSSNLPYVGIWSPYPTRGGFVCIEPWAGIADSENTTGNYNEKIGINHLEPAAHQTHEYCVMFMKD